MTDIGDPPSLLSDHLFRSLPLSEPCFRPQSIALEHFWSGRVLHCNRILAFIAVFTALGWSREERDAASSFPPAFRGHVTTCLPSYPPDGSGIHHSLPSSGCDPAACLDRQRSARLFQPCFSTAFGSMRVPIKSNTVRSMQKSFTEFLLIFKKNKTDLKVAMAGKRPYEKT